MKNGTRDRFMGTGHGTGTGIGALGGILGLEFLNLELAMGIGKQALNE